MNIPELIEKLQLIANEHGPLDVTIDTDLGDSWFTDVEVVPDPLHPDTDIVRLS